MRISPDNQSQHGRPRTRENTEQVEKARQRDREAYYNSDPIHAWASVAYNNAFARAKKKKLPFSITVADLVELAEQTEYCPVLGTKLEYHRGRGDGPRAYAASLDRLDNSEGYHRHNIGIVSVRANAMKGNLTVEELVSLAIYLLSQYRSEQ